MTEPATEKAPRARWRGVVSLVLKLAVAAALLGTLVASGTFKPEENGERFQAALTSAYFPLILLLGAVGLSMSGLRWFILLRNEGITVPLSLALRLTWIGHFWNMVFPGAVSGDAVKMFYIGKAVPDLRDEAWTTVLADRIIGMIALVSLSTFAVLASLGFIQQHEELRTVFYLMIGILSGAALFGLFMVLGVGKDLALVQKLKEKLPGRALFSRAYHSLRRQARRPRVLITTYLISLTAHAMAVTNCYLLGRAAAEATLTATQYAVVIPIGMFSNAIPISPAGLGVGEQVLANLFRWMGGVAGDGVLVMLLFRVVMFTMAGIGAVLYVLHKRNPHSTDSLSEPS